MSNELITIAKFNFPTDPDFQVFTLLLEQEGIQYVCPEENTVGIDPLLSIAVGGLRVQVRKEDAGLAKQLLEEARQQAPPEEQLDEEDLKMRAEQERINQRNAMGCYVSIAIGVVLGLVLWYVFR
jgi:hypothetical protein